MGPLYSVALRRISPAFLAIALTLGLIGIATFYSSNTAFEMLSLSSQYAATTTVTQRTQLEAAGQAMLLAYSGAAFNVYYILSAVVTLIFSAVMLRSTRFSKLTAYIGFAAGVLMFLPPTWGTFSIYLSLGTLVFSTIWLILVALSLYQLGWRKIVPAEQKGA